MRDFLSKSIDFLQGREGLFLVLVGALGVQAPHSAEVFHRISTSHWWMPFSILHCIGFAVVLELAVLLFVVRGRKGLSWGFATISVLMNVFYYYSSAWWSEPGAMWSAIVQCVVTAIALPLAIAFYSHEVAGNPAQMEKKQPVQRTAKPVQAKKEGAQVDKKARAKQLHGEGLSNVQIGKEIGVVHTTVGRWLKATNGANE